MEKRTTWVHEFEKLVTFSYLTVQTSNPSREFAPAVAAKMRSPSFRKHVGPALRGPKGGTGGLTQSLGYLPSQQSSGGWLRSRTGCPRLCSLPPAPPRTGCTPIAQREVPQCHQVCQSSHGSPCSLPSSEEPNIQLPEPWCHANQKFTNRFGRRMREKCTLVAFVQDSYV